MPEDFAALLRGPRSATLTGALVDRIRALGTTSETAAARTEIEQALACKWWGVRVEAIRTIGRWGGSPNKAWLVERARRPKPPPRALLRAGRGAPLRWAEVETHTARSVLPPLLAAEDADWVLDLWFAEYGPLRTLHATLLMHLPEAPVAARIAQELRLGRPADIEALVWLVQSRHSLPGRTEILEALAAREGTEAGRTARHLLRLNARSEPQD